MLSVSRRDMLDLPRNEIKNPGQHHADDDKLTERFEPVNDAIANRATRENAESDSDEYRKCKQIKEMDHFFLP